MCVQGRLTPANRTDSLAPGFRLGSVHGRRGHGGERLWGLQSLPALLLQYRQRVWPSATTTVPLLSWGSDCPQTPGTRVPPVATAGPGEGAASHRGQPLDASESLGSLGQSTPLEMSPFITSLPHSS